MTVYDLIIVGCAIIGFILGFKDGFVRKIIGLTGFAIAIFCAMKFADDVGYLVEKVFDIEMYLAEIIGGIVIFLTIMILTAFLKRVIHPFDKVNNLINQIIGGLVGALQLLFFLSLVFLILGIFNVPKKEVADKSYLYSMVYKIIPTSVNYLNDFTPDTEQKIKDFINR